MSGVLIPIFTLGERMTKAREAAGLRRPLDMAQRLGVTDKTVRNWEGGKTPVTRAVLIAYAAETGVPLWWLEGLDPDDGAQVLSVRKQPVPLAA